MRTMRRSASRRARKPPGAPRTRMSLTGAAHEPKPWIGTACHSLQCRCCDSCPLHRLLSFSSCELTHLKYKGLAVRNKLRRIILPSACYSNVMFGNAAGICKFYAGSMSV